MSLGPARTSVPGLWQPDGSRGRSQHGDSVRLTSATEWSLGGEALGKRFRNSLPTLVRPLRFSVAGCWMEVWLIMLKSSTLSFTLSGAVGMLQAT